MFYLGQVSKEMRKTLCVAICNKKMPIFAMKNVKMAFRCKAVSHLFSSKNKNSKESKVDDAAPN